jgi:acyl-CoA dehydrogenase
MHFALTDEQRALQDAVRSYLRDRFGTRQGPRGLRRPGGDGDPAELWKALVEQGWLAVMVPEEHDGIGLGLLDASIIARAFGAGTVPGPGSAPCWPPRPSAWPAPPSSRRPGCRGWPPARSRALSR